MWSVVLDADHYVVVPPYSFLHWEYAEFADDFQCADEAARIFYIYSVVGVAVFLFQFPLQFTEFFSSHFRSVGGVCRYLCGGAGEEEGVNVEAGSAGDDRESATIVDCFYVGFCFVSELVCTVFFAGVCDIQHIVRDTLHFLFCYFAGCCV